MKLVQPLESRKLFAGGLDAAYGSSTGAFFDAPGDAPIVYDRAIDSAGRTVLVGSTLDSGITVSDAMFIARLTPDGVLDTGFGGAGTGISVGQPRGIKRLTQVVALRSGGYMTIGLNDDLNQSSSRLVKFTASGKLDTAFGIVILDRLQVIELVEQADGKLLVVGKGPGRGDEQGVDEVFYAARYSAQGKLETNFGETDGPIEPDGYAFLDWGDEPDEWTYERREITSASIDSGRLLVGFSESMSYFFNEEDASSTAANYYRRFDGRGLPDASFVGKPVFSADSNEGDYVSRVTVAVARRDGQVAVLSREQPAAGSPTLSLTGAKGQLGPGKAPSVNLSALAAGFDVAAMQDGALLSLSDGKLLVAGSMVNGSSNTPALMRLNTDLTLDTTFGASGILLLPTMGGAVRAANLALNGDGTYAVCLRGPASTPDGDLRIARVFPDDRPIVTLRSATRKGDRARVIVAVRAFNPINVATLDESDLKLINNAGERAKLRLVSTASAGNGDFFATYQATRPRATYSVVIIGGQVRDEEDNGNAAATLATVAI